VETDVVATKVMGFEPNQIGHIRMAVERGLGGWEYELVGNGLDEVRRSFKSP
jgi:hypothetical protein